MNLFTDKITRYVSHLDVWVGRNIYYASEEKSLLQYIPVTDTVH